MEVFDMMEGYDLVIYNFIHLMVHQIIQHYTDALFLPHVSNWEMTFDIAKRNITLKK
jgi:PIN domain nuclease of toxin-antitoxin system